MAKRICIDAGHYAKYNRSPAVPEYWESQRMWALHLLLKAELEAYGFEVVTTRSIQAKDLSLHKRGMAAKGCDLFLSLHSNAAGNSVNEKVDHVSVYRLVDDNTTNLDELSKALAEKLAPVIAQTMEVQGGHKVLTRKSSNDRNGDGQLNDNYYGVLNGARQAGTPGLLLEHSFHTNTRSTKWLLSDANLAKLAAAEATAIAQHFGMEKPTGALYRVQVGAYSKRTNAEAQLAKLQAAGFTDAYIVEAVKEAEKPAPVKPAQPDKTIDQLAREVLAGKHGNGDARKRNLGDKYEAVQKRVNELLKA